MKPLLDECTPKRLRRDFPGHDVFTVEDGGLKGLENGDLLLAAAAGFDALITVDRNIPFQQSLVAQTELRLIILVAHPCRYPELKQLVPKVLEALRSIKPGETIEIW